MARWHLNLGLLLCTLALTLTFPGNFSLAFPIFIAGSITVADRAAGGSDVVRAIAAVGSLVVGDNGRGGLGGWGAGMLAVSDEVWALSATATTIQTTTDSLLNASITAPVGMVDVCEWQSEVCAEGHRTTPYIRSSLSVISPVIAPDVRGRTTARDSLAPPDDSAQRLPQTIYTMASTSDAPAPRQQEQEAPKGEA